MKSFLKQMMEKKSNKEGGIYESERVQTEPVEKNHEFHTKQEVQQHSRKLPSIQLTPQCEDMDEQTDGSSAGQKE